MPEVNTILDESGLRGQVKSMPDLVKTFRSMDLNRAKVKELIGNLVAHVRDVAGPKIAELLQSAVGGR